MIQHLALLGASYAPGDPTDRLVRVLLEQLSLMPKEELSLPMPQDARLRRISRAITLDPSERGTLQSWACTLSVSERTLNRLCTSQTGLSFGRWRRQLHMMVALRELSAGASVQQVAYSLGYESPSAFITMFKKAFGKPPVTYINDRLQVEASVVAMTPLSDRFESVAPIHQPRKRTSSPTFYCAGGQRRLLTLNPSLGWLEPW